MISVMQMCKYYDNKLSTSPSTPAVVFPSSPTKSRAPPTKFAVPRSTYKMKRASQTSTVDAEFCKYISVLSSDGTDILRFWEVNLFITN